MSTNPIVFTKAQLELFEDLTKRKLMAIQVQMDDTNEQVLKELIHNIAATIKIGRENGYVITWQKGK